MIRGRKSCTVQLRKDSSINTLHPSSHQLIAVPIVTHTEDSRRDRACLYKYCTIHCVTSICVIQNALGTQYCVSWASISLSIEQSVQTASIQDGFPNKANVHVKTKSWYRGFFSMLEFRLLFFSLIICLFLQGPNSPYTCIIPQLQQ